MQCAVGKGKTQKTPDLRDLLFMYNGFRSVQVWDSDLKLVLTPVDATNEASVTKGRIQRHGVTVNLWRLLRLAFVACDVGHVNLFLTSQLSF